MDTPLKLLWGILGALVTGLALGGWHAHDFVTTNLASKDAVLVASSKADFALDQQMFAIVAQISFLERKQNKTQDEINGNYIDDLR